VPLGPPVEPVEPPELLEPPEPPVDEEPDASELPPEGPLAIVPEPDDPPAVEAPELPLELEEGAAPVVVEPLAVVLPPPPVSPMPDWQRPLAQSKLLQQSEAMEQGWPAPWQPLPVDPALPCPPELEQAASDMATIATKEDLPMARLPSVLIGESILGRYGLQLFASGTMKTSVRATPASVVPRL
jgi:hypothetical protein